MICLSIRNVSIRFGGIVALDDVSFDVERGQICGLIGPNGAGKTTLFNCICRQYTPQHGEIRFDGQPLLQEPVHRLISFGVGRTFQNLALFRSLSVIENVMVGLHADLRANFLTSLVPLPAVAAEERRARDRAMAALESLGLARYADRPAAGLPHQTLKRVEIARALVANPKLLLLDEPASGLTHSEIGELGALIQEIRRQRDLTILLVEHHMLLVMGISDRIVVLDSGRKIAEGIPKEVQNNPTVIEAYLGSTAAA